MSKSQNRRPSGRKDSRDSSLSRWIEVCSVSAMDGLDMQSFPLDQGTVLITRYQGKFHATGSKCTHYYAPLDKGAICGKRVRCWRHGASFDVTTGDIEDYPAFSDIPVFQCVVNQENKIVIKVNDPEELKTGKRTPKFCDFDLTVDKRRFVVIGGGPAGFTAVKYLREHGFQGALDLVSSEEFLPYYRIKLNKVVISDPKDFDRILLKPRSFYDDAKVTLRLNKTLQKIDISSKILYLNEGQTVSYDKVLLCTGSAPKYPGNFLYYDSDKVDNVIAFREPMESFATTDMIHRLKDDPDNGSDAKRVCVLGSGFLGTEIASFITRYTKNVVLISKEAAPLSKVWGEQFGNYIKRLLLHLGVVILPNSSVSEFHMKETAEERFTLNRVTITPQSRRGSAVAESAAMDEFSFDGFINFVDSDHFMRRSRDVSPIRPVKVPQLTLETGTLIMAVGAEPRTGFLLEKAHTTSINLGRVSLEKEEVHEIDSLLSATLAEFAPRRAVLEVHPVTSCLLVDAGMRSVSDPDVFAAGDITQFPMQAFADSPPFTVHNPHWSNAQAQGKLAAHNMMLSNEEYGTKHLKYDTVPMLWTTVGTVAIKSCGYAAYMGWIGTVTHGSFKAEGVPIEEQKAIVYYLDGKDRVIGATSVNWDPLVVQLAEYLHQFRSAPLTRQDIATSADAWVKNNFEKLCKEK